jgi:hypothetical protein
VWAQLEGSNLRMEEFHNEQHHNVFLSLSLGGALGSMGQMRSARWALSEELE